MHGAAFYLTILVPVVLTSNGVLLANGNAFMVVGYPSQDLVHTLEDADLQGQTGLRRSMKETHELSYAR